jgi:hypothetical protein
MACITKRPGMKVLTVPLLKPGVLPSPLSRGMYNSMNMSGWKRLRKMNMGLLNECRMLSM